MIKNFKNNTLTDSLVSGAAAIALIAGVGIAATPAQAGTLEWDNGTSSFIDQVDFTDPNDTFSVTFSPDSLGGQAAVFIASNEFAPFFGPLPEFVDLTPPPTGTFSFVEEVDSTGIFRYELDNNLTFDFGNGVEVTIGEDSTFLGEIDVDDAGTQEGVEFELEVASVANTSVSIPGFDDPFELEASPLAIIGEEFTFGQAFNATEGGGYQGEFVVQDGGIPPVPEPGTILSLLAVGGLGLGLKRKQQSKQLSA